MLGEGLCELPRQKAFVVLCRRSSGLNFLAAVILKNYLNIELLILLFMVL